MRRVRVEAAAKAELAAAIAWYDEQAPGLGDALHAAVDEALRRLRVAPDGGTPVPGTPPELGVRRVFTRRFPYAVLYIPSGEVVSVIAFAHPRRRPGYWLDRIH
jgi:toxin ParE1/3/4